MRAAIGLVNAAADGAGDEEVTPSRIAGSIQLALRAPEVATREDVQEALGEALDAVADGLPADHVGSRLYAALARLESGPR